jgi:hypothetical protein
MNNIIKPIRHHIAGQPTWQKMYEIMNRDKLHKDPNKPLKHVPRARDEFLQIMEKLSMHVWQHYHPGEDPYQKQNLKTIREIAKSEYFEDLICNALFMKDNGIIE